MSTEQKTLDFNTLTTEQMEEILRAKKEEEERAKETQYTSVESDLKGIERVKTTRDKIDKALPRQKVVDLGVIPKSFKMNFIIIILIGVVMFLLADRFTLKSSYNQLYDTNEQLVYSNNHVQKNLKEVQKINNDVMGQNARLKSYGNKDNSMLQAENYELLLKVKALETKNNELDTKYLNDTMKLKKTIKSLDNALDKYKTYYRMTKDRFDNEGEQYED